MSIMRIGVMGFGLYLGSAIAAAAQEPAAPTGPAAYWRFDETAGTSAANRVAGAPAGTHQNTPTISMTVPTLSYNTDPGATPRSLQFNGTSQGVQVVNFETFTNFTVACWVQRSGTTAARETIVSYKESGNSGFVLCLNEGGANFRPRIFGRINDGTANWDFIEEATTINTGAWEHLAASYDGTDLKLYRGATLSTIAVPAGTMVQNTATTAIGMRNSNDQHYFPGLIDDVRIYGRALSAVEVSVLAAGVPAPTGLAATDGVNEVSLVWTAPPQAVTYTYRVCRRAAGSTGAYTVIAPAVATTSYTDTTAAGGASYEYAVRAVSVAESGLSAPDTGVSSLPPPRTNDHDEGLFGEKCECGTVSSAGAAPWAAFAALALFALARRRIA
jgi:hypothetical protein